MSNRLDVLIRGILEGLLRKDRLLILWGKSDTGKSFAARVLAEIFGPYVNLDERQIGRDQLVLDDIINKQAKCLWLEELDFNLDYSPVFKRILSGYIQGGRKAKSKSNPYETYRSPLIICTTNINPEYVPWLHSEGMNTRCIFIKWDKRLEWENCETISDYVKEGKRLLLGFKYLFLKTDYKNLIENRELFDLINVD